MEWSEGILEGSCCLVSVGLVLSLSFLVFVAGDSLVGSEERLIDGLVGNFNPATVLILLQYGLTEYCTVSKM